MSEVLKKFLMYFLDKQPEAVWRCRDWAWIIFRSSVAGWTGCYWQKGKGGKEFLFKCGLNYFTSITLKVSFEQKGIFVWKQSSLVLSSLPWRLTLEIILWTDERIKAVFLERGPWSRKTFRWKRNQCSWCGLSEEETRELVVWGHGSLVPLCGRSVRSLSLLLCYVFASFRCWSCYYLKYFPERLLPSFISKAVVNIVGRGYSNWDRAWSSLLERTNPACASTWIPHHHKY